MYGTPQYWEEKDPARAAEVLTRTVSSIERWQYARLLRARTNVAAYERRPIAGLHPAAYLSVPSPADGQNPGIGGMTQLPILRSLVNTVLAKIAGKQRPKIQFCVNQSDWATKRKALRLEKFVEAVMQSRQGLRHDAWDVAQAAFRDCLITDCGVVKCTADASGKIAIERRFPWEVFFDPAEMKHGHPQNIFDIYGYDRHQLADQFPNFKQQILCARPLSQSARGTEDNLTWGEEAGSQIRVIEAYRLRIGKTPGRRFLVIGEGTDAVDLLDGKGEWDHDFFPYLFLRWEPWVVGEYGTSLVDNAASMVDDLNDAFARWREAERLLSAGFLLYKEGSIDPKLLLSNEIGNVVPWNGGDAPQIITPNTLGATSQNYTGLLKTWIYEFPGVSQMAATGSNPEGVEAAIAMRTLDNQATERFSIPWQEYERVTSVGLARLIVAAAKQLAEDDPDFEVSWASGGKLKRLKWSDVEVDLPDEAYTIASVSGLVNTPADRLQLASELRKDGIISNETYLEVIQAKGIAAELEQNNEASKWIDEQIDSWLDYEEGQEGFRYRAPLRFLGIDLLTNQLVRVARAYLRADSEDAPDEVIQWFVRFMGDCDKQIQGLQQQAAALQAASAGRALPQPETPR